MATVFPTAPFPATKAPWQPTSPVAPAIMSMPSTASARKIWEENLDRLTKKFATARTLVPEPEMIAGENATVGIISLGSNHEAMLEARDRLAAEGVHADYLRLRALPIGQGVRDFIATHDKVIVVEIKL